MICGCVLDSGENFGMDGMIGVEFGWRSGFFEDFANTVERLSLRTDSFLPF